MGPLACLFRVKDFSFCGTGVERDFPLVKATETFRTYRIGLAIDTIGSYGRGVIRGVMGYCRAHPYLVVSVEPIAAPHRSGAYAQIDDWDVDGLVVQTLDRESEERVLARGLPAVNVSNVSSDPPRLPAVLPDDDAIGVMAAKYLLTLGSRCIGYVWPANSHYGRVRLAALRRELATAGMSVRECDYTRTDVTRWLAELPKPAAVLGCNDDSAHHVMNVARRSGLSVPDDIAVLGVDDDELFNMLVTPSLSSIRLPTEEIGQQSAALLEQMMRAAEASGETKAKQRASPPPMHTLPPGGVMERESTHILSAEDPDVEMSLRFIRDHAAHPLSVSDLLQHVPLGRRTLERRFRAIVGRSIQEEICRVRLEKAKQLLAGTSLSIPQVARGSGFGSENRFGIAFRKAVGVPPTEYRRRARGMRANGSNGTHGR